MYHVVGLITPQSDFSLPELTRRLQSRLPDHEIRLEQSRIIVKHNDWSIHLQLESGSDLQDEIEGLVDRLAGIEPQEAEQYVASGQRLQVFSEDVDPVMEHFDTYLAVVEVLKSFSGMLVVDPKEPGVM
jgi:hypothetical protein